MPDFSKGFPSKYLKAVDFIGKRVNATIDKVLWESIQDGDEPKPVIYFKGSKKGFVANVTNCSLIAEMAGSRDTDDWPNTKIVLFTIKVKNPKGGGLVDGFSVELPEEMKAKQKVETWGDSGEDAGFPPDDDIPF